MSKKKKARPGDIPSRTSGTYKRGEIGVNFPSLNLNNWLYFSLRVVFFFIWNVFFKKKHKPNQTKKTCGWEEAPRISGGWQTPTNSVRKGGGAKEAGTRRLVTWRDVTVTLPLRGRGTSSPTSHDFFFLIIISFYFFLILAFQAQRRIGGWRFLPLSLTAFQLPNSSL